MRSIKLILNHNINNFVMSVSLYCQLYKDGSVTEGQLFVGMCKCFTERMKFFHWYPANF